MSRVNNNKDKFAYALEGKNIPVVTLDNKWYRLLSEIDRKNIKSFEESLNNFLRRQGKLNTESREIKLLKKKLMNEVVHMVDEAEQGGGEDVEKKISEHKRLIEECNVKIDGYQDELLEIPKAISEANHLLMLETMECCYNTIQDNTDEIKAIEEWVTATRIELKKKLIIKQELEQKNYEIYSYMHDIFGADVMDLFDIKYNPEEHHPTIPESKGRKINEQGS